MESQIATQYRHLFPVLKNVTYLNSCSQGALAIPVRDAINQYMDGMYAKGSLWDEWVEKSEDLRRLTAEAFSTRVDNVAITASASAGINSIISSFSFEGGKNQIVTSDLEFPTMGQILYAQERRGAKILRISSKNSHTFDLDNFEEKLSAQTALVAITHVCYRNGNMTDIKSVVEIAHKHGIPVLVDAYQSAGVVPIDFEELGADFLVGGYLKYLLGIPGVGFVLARPESSQIPSMTGWFAAKDVFSMSNSGYDPASDARRFAGGTPPIPSVYGALAGIEFLLNVGINQAWEHTLMLHDLLKKELSELGVQIVTSSKLGTYGAMLAIAPKNDEAVLYAMQEQGIIVSTRNHNIRISPHFYNNRADVDRVITFVKNNLALFR